jgi:hypothetical protein
MTVFIRLLASPNKWLQALNPLHPSSIKRLYIALFACLSYFAFAASANGADLSNNTINLQLGFTPNGAPVIEKANWLDTGEEIFVDTQAADGLQSWIPEKFIPATLPPIEWNLSADASFYRGEATRDLLNGLRMTWIVELAKTGATFRLKIRLQNAANEVINVKWFPTWNANWQMQDKAEWVKWWRALSYTQEAKSLAEDGSVILWSRQHSSNFLDEGANPYWVVGSNTNRIFFGLEWCGGWEAKLFGDNGTLSFNVRLPQEETQLALEPNESIEGPTLWVTPTNSKDEAMNRRAWMIQRRAIARRIYRGSPVPSFPLTYNNWYSSYFDINSHFLQRQIEAMEPYTFNAFILDAGWYQKPGNWKANRSKFQQGELEQTLAAFKAKGIKPGLWSAPQLIDSTVPALTSDADLLSAFNDSIGGNLIDLAGSDYTARLQDHVSSLRSKYSMDWWKYDQPLFVENSHSGAMKNVIAFQDALRAVRINNPNLSIENCLNGGRMINELTVLTSQAIWLRDGPREGLEHARQNVEISFNAMEFLFPWTAYRFTKNFELLDPNDDELTRFYCRSAMMGTWGISSDLGLISAPQQKVILKEIKYYKQLNAIKLNYLYEMDKPAQGKEAAGITFYDAKLQRAGLLLYRWDGQGAFNYHARLQMLDASKTYKICDADSKTIAQMSGADLLAKGFDVAFAEGRLSALIFIEPVKEAGK